MSILDIVCAVSLVASVLVYYAWNPLVGSIDWIETRQHERDGGYVFVILVFCMFASINLDEASIGAIAIFYSSVGLFSLVSNWAINKFPYRRGSTSKH